MKKHKIGAITIGQSPRDEVLSEMLPLLGPEVEVLQAGALDGLSAADIALLAPHEGGRVLVSRLRDGGWVRMEEEKLLPLLQDRIDGLVAQGVEMILLLCTGPFPEGFRSPVPLIYPQKLMYGVAPALSTGGHLGIVNPDPAQLDNMGMGWKQVARDVTAVSVNPYAPEGIVSAAEALRDSGADLVVLDCIGYSRAMQREFANITGLPVLLPRTVLARLAAELLGD